VVLRQAGSVNRGSSSDLLAAARKLPDGKRMALPRRRQIIAAIETERQRLVLPVEELARRAGLSPRSYARIKAGESASCARVLRQLAIALQRPEARQPVTDGAALKLMLDGLALMLHAQGLPQARGRQVAIYMLHVEVGVTQRLVAAVAGVTEQAVSKTTRTVEDLRDGNAAVEAAIAAVMTGPQRSLVAA
jgi:transcriptional regulator with XRE-family HTH domain